MLESRTLDRYDEDAPATPHPGMGFVEFVTCVAMIQATIALAVDVMVPALGQIGASMHLPAANERQWVITAFVSGFGLAQLVYGLAADRFGRRKVLLTSLGIYVLAAFLAATAPGFTWLLAARLLQGVGAAGAKVVTVAIIRDCYSGRRMAQVNSLSFAVFLAAPIFAPSIGQFVLLFAPWQAIFIGLASYGALIAAWAAIRLPETQHQEDRRAIAVREATAALRLTLTNRMSLYYTLAATFVMGGWLGFIVSAQQVFTDIFLKPKLFPLIFASCSISMAVAALTNARLVERLGMRPLSHAALCGFIAASVAQAIMAFSGHDNLLIFALLQSAMMFCFGLMGGNFSAISMEPLGHIAGTAASIQGSLNTLGAAAIAFLIGESFNGTLHPLGLGFCICSLLSLAMVLTAERGRMFRARHS
jgi:MFS transporter, DHA1 family, multidrug resistance protein